MDFAERILAPLATFKARFSAQRMNMAHDGVLQIAPRCPDMPRQVAAALKDGVSISCPDPTAEERLRDMHQAHGQKLARIEDWERLTKEIFEADAQRLKTPGGMPIAELLAFGARADVVGAAEHALIGGRPDRDAPMMAGIEAMESILAENPDNPALACVVALTHIDLGWAWRGTGWDIEVPSTNREAFAAHFDRATNIMAEFDAAALESPLLASTQCALLAGRSSTPRQVARQFETWIDLDPKNPRSYRAFGVQLLPRWNGSLQQLELQARRAAGRTHDVWGAGAYTWVMFDAISHDPDACAQIDLEFFLDGLHDILHNSSDQHTVNLLLAYCANTMGATQTGDDETDYVRMQIAAAADWIVRDYLSELHPLLWAHAARGFDNALRIRCPERFAASGHADALHFLTEVFRRELTAGKQIIFTKDGPEARAA
ncbi:hypothetical protein [Tateyamaria sp.]|uniref:hypothetical protein n=1 Tax=Tateyamaria sp. TaxID=1929288 RepID=UPI00329AFB7B